jgi:hypothetical protein
MTKIHFGSSPRFHRYDPRVLLNLTAMFYFGAPDFGDLKPQPFFFFLNLSEGHDLVMHATPWINDYNFFGTSDFENLKIQNLSSPTNFIQSPGFGDTWLMVDQWLRSFQVFAFLKSQTSNPLLAHFFLEHFIWST